MNDKDRRDAKRFAIRVLVNCLPPGKPVRRNGHETKGWEMWAKDIADDGVGLEWSRDWALGRCPSCSAPYTGRKADPRAACQCQSPGEVLKKGQQVQLDGLIYTDQGSRPMNGRIQWVRPGRNGKTYEVGVHITSPNHRSFFKALEA
ncbi:MAG TPA: hypothetical protein VMU17_05685 [Elusimicrobiota bacterium]|nr:hypothetical protein [Elusimicrobiota bacterium]